MKCPHCNEEIRKTIIINRVEYELEQHDNDKTLSKIKIPKGWRLLLPSEAMMLYERGLINNTFWFFVQQTNEEEGEKGNVAGFGADSVRAFLDCDRDPSNRNAGLGVIFCRDLKAKNKQ
jgi:hypothetical protein